MLEFNEISVRLFVSSLRATVARVAIFFTVISNPASSAEKSALCHTRSRFLAALEMTVALAMVAFYRLLDQLKRTPQRDQARKERHA